MAAAKTAAPKAAPSLLPLPRPMIEHHGESLFPQMRQWAAQKRVPPVLLLTGPSGVGKRSIVHFLSQWLLCARNGLGGGKDEDQGQGDMFGGGEPAAAPSQEIATEPCGECGSCQRALHANWVDFTEISGETGDGDSGALKIEQFRKLKSTMGFGAFDGAYRIVLIRDADRMTVQAANSLLKLLEEPPPGWVLFLTASDPSLLLPTLVSRCQQLRLRPFSAEKLQKLLETSGVAAERRVICAGLAQGSWKKALALASDEVWERRSTLFTFLEKPHAELSGLVDWAAQESANFELLADQLEQIASDLVRWSLNPAQGWINQDGAKALAAHAAARTRRDGSPEAARAFWTSRAERLFRARQEALAPLNRKLLIQDILVPWI